MKRNWNLIHLSLLIAAAVLLAVGIGLSTHQDTNAANSTYKILAWNDLGMHCYNRDFADLAVLPPYNNLWVQVVQAGDPPKLVTAGITVSYSYADNTYSVGKTNFWTYAKALFGVTLPPNVGLKGKGLAGKMDLSGDHFVAEGIPLTEYSDSAPTIRQPYQLATVVVKNSVTGVVLATQSVVTPTSSEMRCDKCHSDTGIAAPEVPTGKVETNILKLHDQEAGTNLMNTRPVLCAICHGSNALGAPGKPGVPNLSNAMHNKHTGVVTNTLDGCYNCHPGPVTRCLRDVMSVRQGMNCISCHGTIDIVANNPTPWLNEPRCDRCHNSGAFNQDKALYRLSREHGGLFCEACHDSTHAIAPSREARDGIKFIALQGTDGPLSACSVCHTVPPDPNFGPHRVRAVIHTISGNAGVAGAVLSYTDGTSKKVLADANGNYSLTVTHNWTGRVTPSKPGVPSFTPAFRAYTNVTANQTNQNYKPNTLSSFGSIAVQDGFILESAENSGVGGTLNATASIFAVGDNNQNKQFRSILSFNTAALPDNAVIVSAKLKISRQSTVGTNPFTTHGLLVMDLKKPNFGASPALGLYDFNSLAGLTASGSIGSIPVGATFTGGFTPAALAYINRSGLTQLRLRFQLDDNNNNSADYLAFFSAESTTAVYRPVLQITYYVP